MIMHIMLPKTTAYVKIYDGQAIWMYFLIEDDDLLEKYNTILDKVSADIQKNFDSESVYKKVIWKPKQNIMTMKLLIFTMKRLLN